MILTELCAHLRNWFVRSDSDKHIGTYEITSGIIDLPWLADGQYFRIVGSVFNDGVWQYPTSELVDETFDGAIWAMAVPPDVEALVSEIGAWEEKYRDAVHSPYASESFGGYAYTKADGCDSWRTAFRSRLARWRKL